MIAIYSKLVISTLPEPELFQGEQEFSFQHPITGFQTIPRGFVTDFASIPRFFSAYSAKTARIVKKLTFTTGFTRTKAICPTRILPASKRIRFFMIFFVKISVYQEPRPG